MRIREVNSICGVTGSEKIVQPSTAAKTNSRYLKGASKLMSACLNAWKMRYCIRLLPMPKMASRHNCGKVGMVQQKYAGIKLKTETILLKYINIVSQLSCAIIFLMMTSCRANTNEDISGIITQICTDVPPFISKLVQITNATKAKRVTNNLGAEIISFNEIAERSKENSGTVQHIITT